MDSPHASSRIFVQDLPPTINEADLRKHFERSQFHITDVKLKPQRRFAFVGFKSPEEAQRAVKLLNRSYIRMSRIKVDLAKDANDSSLAKKKPVKVVKTAASKSIPADRSPEANAEANGKKRKRDALDESDPKLQEFLGVMRPSRNSENKMLVAESQETDLHPRKITAVAADGPGSDTEYEDVPSRQSKRAAVQTTSHTAPTRPQTHLDDTDSKGAIDATITQPDVPPGGVAATDDDWLRSRTNRLLDLVDGDEVMTEPSLQQTAQKESELPRNVDVDVETEAQPNDSDSEPQDTDATLDAIQQTSRLFCRNLPYEATEDDIRQHFQRYGSIEEIHVPTDSSNKNKGFAFVLFHESDSAVDAFRNADGATFQGRILHILAGSAKREAIDEFALSKLPLKQQNLLRKKAKAATSKFNWNSLYMNQDAVNTSIAERLGISKSELLDPTNADSAVKQAIAETTVIQDTRAYFIANGVDLNALKSAQRDDASILVKNFHGTSEEIRNLFEEYGKVLRVLMPPTGTIAIVQFAQASEAKTAFAKLAYRRFKNTVLFLEKGPKNLFIPGAQQATPSGPAGTLAGLKKPSATELLDQDVNNDEVETSSLFVGNLNFSTTTEQLSEAFASLDGFKSALVKTKTDPKKPGQVLSMGFGFVHFSSKASAEAALKVMDGHALQAHKLQVKASHRGHDAAEERKRDDLAKKAAGQRTKIIIKNLPFQASKKDIRTLMSTYGQVRSVRVPKNISNRSKGFAFAEFLTAREAENAMNALQNTHLLGRKLVLQFAEADIIDPELEIAKMQKKVGGQVNKVAMQQLAGASRKRVNLGEDEDEGDM